ncbi:hypothetical protein DFH09DRAFT_1081567 [Mycena vulgaris]|nr:hypothetical protein DFH09DRAFT_1081567 [Mycena vulgaris]
MLTVTKAAAQETPHPFPGVGIDPRFRLPFTPEHAAAAEKMREEREKTGDFSLPTSSSSVQSPSAPPQPMPCIGIGPNARLPYTEEHAEEARKIRAERAAIGGTSWYRSPLRHIQGLYDSLDAVRGHVEAVLIKDLPRSPFQQAGGKSSTYMFADDIRDRKYTSCALATFPRNSALSGLRQVLMILRKDRYRADDNLPRQAVIWRFRDKWICMLAKLIPIHLSRGGISTRYPRTSTAAVTGGGEHSGR